MSSTACDGSDQSPDQAHDHEHPHADDHEPHVHDGGQRHVHHDYVHVSHTHHVHGSGTSHTHHGYVVHSHHGHAPHDHVHDDDHGHAHGNDASYTPVDAEPTSRGVSSAQFAAASRILYVDPVAGAAGDMLLAALIDLGLRKEAVEEIVRATQLEGFELELGRRSVHSLSARTIRVNITQEQPSRPYAVIAAMLANAKLPPRVAEIAQRAFLRLGEVEAAVHGQPLETVHFHEVGGVDAIVDIVGVSAALTMLEEQAGGRGRLGIAVGSLPVGSGIVRGAHGMLPIPAPATLALLRGLPVRDAKLPPGVDAELITPTGAALLRAATELMPSMLGSWPSMVPEAVGYGAGTRNLPDRPNVVRLVLGAPTATNVPQNDGLTLLETNVDDTTGEYVAACIEALLEGGALDAWAQPITMKKGRPAWTLSALTQSRDRERLGQVLLAHSGSLGVRYSSVQRDERPRRSDTVSTPYGPVRVKISDADGLSPVVHPEFDDCRARALTHRVPVREVARAALVAFSQLGSGTTP